MTSHVKLVWCTGTLLPFLYTGNLNWQNIDLVYGECYMMHFLQVGVQASALQQQLPCLAHMVQNLMQCGTVFRTVYHSVICSALLSNTGVLCRSLAGNKLI